MASHAWAVVVYWGECPASRRESCGVGTRLWCWPKGAGCWTTLSSLLCHRHIPGVAGKLELRGEQCLGTGFLFSISGYTVHYDLEEDILHQQPMALSSLISRGDDFWCSMKIIEVHCIALATALDPIRPPKTPNGVTQGRVRIIKLKLSCFWTIRLRQQPTF